VSIRIRRVQEYVEGHVEEVRTLDELAEVAGLSRYHFARRFRDEVGEPPWAFVRRVRDERARTLLRGGRAPAEVAHEAGFADQAHLTRALRARYGQTPGQIRRAAVVPAEPPAEATPNRKDVQELECPAA
jgi:transcriptional regulator GlxA family with amidase domain